MTLPELREAQNDAIRKNTSGNPKQMLATARKFEAIEEEIQRRKREGEEG